jgi:hypothetical protein
MKTIPIFILSLLTLNPIFSQSKKDLEQSILQLEEKIKNLEKQLEQNTLQLGEKNKNLENEIANIKLNLTNTITTMGLVSKSNLDLEQQVKNQRVIIEKLIKQNDSLLASSRVKKDDGLITNPQTEEDSIISIIQSYYLCKKWEDRLAYVLKPDLVKPLMQSYYADYSLEPRIIKKDNLLIQGANFKNNELFKVVGGDLVFYFKKTTSGIKMDWEGSVGYNSISMKAFKATLNTVPTAFRVHATIGNSYYFNYGDASSTHWNVQVDNDDDRISGCYISKNSAEGKKLYEILKDGKKHKLILEIKIDSSSDNSGNTAIITKVVKEGWSKE